jgi:hypothetical protein
MVPTEKQTMKNKRCFPNRADLHYWQLRQPLPKWASGIGLAIASCSIDDVVNSHAPKDERDPHFTVYNTLNTLRIIRRSEGNYNQPGEMMRKVREYSQRPYGGRAVHNYTRESFYGIFCRRILKKINRNPLTIKPVTVKAIAYS